MSSKDTYGMARTRDSIAFRDSHVNLYHCVSHSPAFPGFVGSKGWASLSVKLDNAMRKRKRFLNESERIINLTDTGVYGCPDVRK